MRPVIARGSRGSVNGPVLARRLFRKLIALERGFSMSPPALESPSLANMFAASRHPAFDFFLCVRLARESAMELRGAKSRRSRLCSGLSNTPGNSSALMFRGRNMTTVAPEGQQAFSLNFSSAAAEIGEATYTALTTYVALTVGLAE